MIGGRIVRTGYKMAAMGARCRKSEVFFFFLILFVSRSILAAACAH